MHYVYIGDDLPGFSWKLSRVVHQNLSRLIRENFLVRKGRGRINGLAKPSTTVAGDRSIY